MACVMITGGCGFIGSNLVHHLLETQPDTTVIDVDLLTYAGNLDNHAHLFEPPEARHRFFRLDCADVDTVRRVFLDEGPIDVVFHLAAESHVDRSIASGAAFARTNVVGTQVMLEAARDARVRRFVHVSTDEVYGSAPLGTRFTESSPLRPSSPYSASKAGADLLVLAFQHTFPDLEVVVTRCSNNYGPYQFPEKLIPLMLLNALVGEPLPVYGDGQQIRDWIHVHDHCRALVAVADRGRPGEVYNIGADNEWANLDLVKKLLELAERDDSLIRFVTDRPGHDRRYAIDSTKIRQHTGWSPRIPFERGLADTVEWYREHEAWCEKVRSGEYRCYYEEQYAERLAASKA